MKYTISIDQVHAMEWELSFSEAAVFSFCNELSTWAEPIVIDGQVWYFASRNKVIDELPWITEKPDTVYRAYRALQEKGVIRWQKHGVKDCIQLTGKGKMWNSEKNPSVGKKSESARKFIRVSSEKNPTDNNTIDKYTSNKSESAPAPNTTGINGSQLTPPPCSAPPPSPQQVGARNAPTPEEMAEYLEDLFLESKWQPRFISNPPETAAEIHDYYTSNGWKVGRNPMKDWRAACRNWLKNNATYGKSKPQRNVSDTPRQEKPFISEDTHRRALAITLAELGVTGGRS